MGSLASRPETSQNTFGSAYEMKPRLRFLLWAFIALLGGLALGTIALHRGEQINAVWLVTAAMCTYALGYRLLSKFIAAKVRALEPASATPPAHPENGR